MKPRSATPAPSFPARSRVPVEALEDRKLLAVSMVSDLAPGMGSSRPQNLVNVNGTLFFTASPSGLTGQSLYRSDGTHEGTRLLRDIQARGLTAVGNTLFFMSG